MITGQGLLDRRHMRHIEGVCTHLNNILVGNFYSYLQAHTQSQQPEIDRPQTEMGPLRVSPQMSRRAILMILASQSTVNQSIYMGM